MKVLVADDDPICRALLESLLSQWECEVVLAGDAEEAWEILQGENAPSLVVLDWMIPGMDGFELCRRIRQFGHGEDVYIILLTSTCQKQEMIKIVVAGADDYLVKPFEPLDVKIRLQAAIRILNLQAEAAQLRQSLQHQAKSHSLRIV